VPTKAENISRHGTRRVLRARYVFPVSAAPIADGSITIDGERIALPASKAAEAQAEDLGNVAILPGLINAHTHLEFSNLAAPLGEPGMGFVEWIRLAVGYRQRTAAEASAIKHGLEESTRLGTTALGEIAQPGWPVEDLQQAKLDATVFLELIAPTKARIPLALLLAREHLGRRATMTPFAASGGEHLGRRATMTPLSPRESGTGGEGVAQSSHEIILGQPALGAGLPTPPNNVTWRPGLGPHAPYSVHPDLLARVVALSAEHRVPLAMHLAESQEELELLRCGRGPLRARLEELGAWEESCQEPSSRTPLSPCGRGVGGEGAVQSNCGVVLGRPLHYLRMLAAAHRTLIIHGNYLDAEEIAFLAAHAGRMTVVYCPRTHAFFRHAAYPLEKMLSAGVIVALGTDSRASSPDLSVLAEMRRAAARHPTVSGETLLKMATLHGAKALGLDHALGSLEPGKSADLAIVALPNRHAADPYDLLLNSNLPVVATWRRGVEIAKRLP